MTDSSPDITAELRALRDTVGRLVETIDRPPVRWLTIADAAKYAGICPRSLRGLIAMGKLRQHKPVPGRCVVDRLELDRYIASTTPAAQAIRSGRGRGRTAE